MARMQTTGRGRRLKAWSAAWVAALAGAAWGQTQPAPDDPLRGPRVERRAVPGADEMFGRTAEGQRRAGANAIPLGEFMNAVRALEADDAPADLRLSAEQSETIRGIEREFRAATREYYAAHARELRALRASLPPQERRRLDAAVAERLGEARPGADQPARPEPDAPRRRDARPGRPASDAGQPTPPATDSRPGDAPARRERPDRPAPRDPAPAPPIDEMPAPPAGEGLAGAPGEGASDALTRLREIRDGAPRPGDAQERVWHVLTEPQQAFVRVRLDEFKARQFEQRQMERLRRERGDAAADAAAPARDPSLAADPELRGLPEVARRRLESLPPEQRAAAVERLKQRLRQRAQPSDGADAPVRRPAKPPPPIKDIDVPPPDPDDPA